MSGASDPYLYPVFATEQLPAFAIVNAAARIYERRTQSGRRVPALNSYVSQGFRNLDERWKSASTGRRNRLPHLLRQTIDPARWGRRFRLPFQWPQFLIHTCQLNGVNSFEYLVELL